MTWQTNWLNGMNQQIAGLYSGNATKMFNAIIGGYTVTMGYWFYVFIMLITMGMIQLKGKNFGNTLLVGLLISGIALPFMPSNTFGIIIIMMALGITFSLYKLFYKGQA
jgi:hypothetical protein